MLDRFQSLYNKHNNESQPLRLLKNHIKDYHAAFVTHQEKIKGFRKRGNLGFIYKDDRESFLYCLTTDISIYNYIVMVIEKTEELTKHYSSVLDNHQLSKKENNIINIAQYLTQNFDIKKNLTEKEIGYIHIILAYEPILIEGKLSLKQLFSLVEQLIEVGSFETFVNFCKENESKGQEAQVINHLISTQKKQLFNKTVVDEICRNPEYANSILEGQSLLIKNDLIFSAYSKLIFKESIKSPGKGKFAKEIANALIFLKNNDLLNEQKECFAKILTILDETDAADIVEIASKLVKKYKSEQLYPSLYASLFPMPETTKNIEYKASNLPQNNPHS